MLTLKLEKQQISLKVFVNSYHDQGMVKKTPTLTKHEKVFRYLFDLVN